MGNHSTTAMKLLTLKGDKYPPENLPASRALLHGENVRDEHMVIEQPDGKRLIVTTSASPLRNDNDEVVAAVGLFDDITERRQMADELEEHREQLEELVKQRTEQMVGVNKQLQKEVSERREAEKKVRNLAVRLIEAQEKERRRVGKELHDEVGGSLTLLKLATSRAKQTPAEKIGGTLEELETVADEVYEQVRTLSHAMDPRTLDDLGLLDALSSHFEEYGAQVGLNVNFEHTGIETRLSRDTEIVVFRIIQEALVNAVRHAKASSVNVRLVGERDMLHLQIEDTGCGFDPTQMNSHSSGLSGMRDRAHLAGGDLVIDSSPGAGTCITCELPLRREQG
jgi:signal transduction histidine kinase